VDTPQGTKDKAREDEHGQSLVGEDAARAHVIAPQHTQGVETEIVDPALEVSIEVARLRTAPRGVGVDLGEFGLTTRAGPRTPGCTWPA